MPHITITRADGTKFTKNETNPLSAVNEAFTVGHKWVHLEDGNYDISSAMSIALPNYPCGFTGGPGAKIRISSTTPATIRLPGYSTSTARVVSTMALGAYLHSLHSFCPHFTFGGWTDEGIVSTAASSGHYSGFTVHAAKIVWRGTSLTSNTSLVYDSGNVLQSAYKPAVRRNFLSQRRYQFGEDPWVEPNPERARGFQLIAEPGGNFLGEPLAESGVILSLLSATPVVTPVWVRKGGSCQWPSKGINYGERYSGIERLTFDYILGGIPTANDTLLISSENPHTKLFDATTLTWKAAPTLVTEVLIGASAAASIMNLVAAINRNSALVGGLSYCRALKPSEYLPGGVNGTATACRIESLRAGDAGLETQPMRLLYSPQVMIVTPLVDAGGVAFAREIHSGTFALGTLGNTRRGHWSWGMVQEDTFGSSVGSSDVSADVFVKDILYFPVTTAAQDLSPNPYGEYGHHNIERWTGEQNSVRSFIKMGDSGWNHIEGPAIGVPTFTGTKGLIHIGVGTHTSKRISLSGNVSDGDKLTIVDGNGGSKVFEFDNNGTVAGGSVSVTIGSDSTVSLQNLRQAIDEQVDLHLLQAYVPAGITSPTMDVTFFTLSEYTVTASVTDTVDSGVVITITDVSSPATCNFCDITLFNHAAAGSSASNIPSVYAERVNNKITVRGSLTNLFELNANALIAHDLSQAFSYLFVNAVPVDGDTMTLDSVHSGAAGTAVTIHCENTAGMLANTATDWYVNIQTNNTKPLFAAALVALINSQAIAFTRAYAAYDWGVQVDTSSLLVIADGREGVNATIVAKTGAGPTIYSVTGITGGLGTIVMQVSDTGSADSSLSGLNLPLFFDSCKEVDVSDVVVCSNVNGANLPAVLAYIKQSATSVGSKINFSNIRCHNAWGRGRFGVEALVMLGTNMTTADARTSGSNIVDGRIL